MANEAHGDGRHGERHDDGRVVWRRNTTLPFQRMDEDALVVDPRTREVHLLNETAARIWELLETASSIDDLCAALAEEYEGAPADALRREVEAFVDDLRGKGLLLPRGRA
jgi:PqqD family protein of HPr-rel-A system